MNDAKITRRSLRRRRFVTWGVFFSVIAGGISFGYKLWEFVRTANQGQMPGFAYATVVSYFVATLGFLCLAVWAFLRGHYDDIEAPKTRLLETEAELDRLEGIADSSGGSATMRREEPRGAHA